jgi:hypothetical protein
MNRTGLITPTKRRDKDTLGLKRPPVTRKNNHAEVSKLNPIEDEIYSTCWMLEAGRSPDRFSAVAAWIPPKPIKRKNAVPINSRNAAARSSEKLEKSGDNSILAWFELGSR